MNAKISFNDVMKIIDKTNQEGKAVPFDITFRTLQRYSKTGGKLLEYKQVRKYLSKKFIPNKKNILKSVKSGSIIKKNPKHYMNRTRNLELQNGDIKKIHIRLIISINGLKIHY